MLGRQLFFLPLVVLFLVTPAGAVIKVDTPLKSIEESGTYILVGKVEQFFPDKPAMLVAVKEDIKGKAPFRAMPINCKVEDPKTAKENLIEPLLKRFGPDQEIVFFIKPRGNSYITFGFTNGTWFQLQGTKVEPDRAVFALKSAEPYYRKAFKGTTAELVKVLKDHAAGKGSLPPLDGKLEPGLGPEYKAKEKGHRDTLSRAVARLVPPSLSLPAATRWAPLGVIPTLGIGAPLAILALLFPTVFGGVFVLFRQWLAFITAISMNSTLLLLHWWLKQNLLRGTWWGDDPALWLVMTGCTFACLFWAWRRQLEALAAGEREASQRTELWILLFMSICCLGTVIFTWVYTGPVRWSDAGWTLTIVLAVGILAGTLYRAWSMLRPETLFGAPSLPTEAVILATFLLGHLIFVPAIWGHNVVTSGAVEVAEGAPKTAKIGQVVKRWDFTAEPKGMYASSPVVEGDAVFASYCETGTQLATLVRLDRQTGLKKWEFFGKNDDLRQMISTPCFADGKLYFGEGFHDDKNCRVFCVDAEKGVEIWNFKTAGQTESSPAVANGKVYIGAGNDGVYCLDAKTGKELWKFPPKDYRGRLLRFGGGMRVEGNRLYCATGVDRNERNDKGETAAFCLDADDGKLLWKAPAPYPVWSKPIVKDGFVYLTTGNGDVMADAAPPEVPGGALLCLDAETGKEKWRFKTINGIIEAPAVDEGRVYFGCRDGQVYCVGRADGKERWRHFLHSPVLATPVLDVDADQRTVSVFAIASEGKVCCLNPTNGDIFWTYDLTQQRAYISTSPVLVVHRTKDGTRRQLFFGAGLGGGVRELADNRPVFYCLEDTLHVE